MAWYLPAKGENGAAYLRGPYDSEYEAELKGEEIQGEHVGEPIDFPTISLSRATQMFKERRIKKEGLESATKRVRHK